jgi:hypothetical protein
MFKKYCPDAKKLYFLPIIFLILLGLLFSLKISPVFAQAETFNFQGKIVRNDAGNEGLNVTAGSPVCVSLGPTNDTCDFRVKYYSAATSGTLLGTEVFANKEIGEYNGIFNLALGTGSYSAGSESSFRNIFLNNSSVYMEVDFAPDGSSYTETFLDGNGDRMAVRGVAYSVSSSGANKQFQFDILNDPSGTGYSNISAGQVYYDGTNNVLRLYDGSDWLAVQASVGNVPTIWDVNDSPTPDVIYSYAGLDVALGGTDSSAGFFYDVSAELLTLTNTTSGLSFRVNDEAGDTTPFAIAADGKVGIGTDTPGQKLEVSGGKTLLKAASDAYALGLGRNDGAGIFNLGVNAAASPNLYFSNNAGQTRFVIMDGGTVQQVGTADTEFKFTIKNGTTDSTHIDWSLAKQSNNKDLWITAYNGTATKEFVKFDYDNEITNFNSGRVGIGVASPTAWLGIQPATTSYAQLNLESSEGVDPSSPVEGDLWWNGTNLYFFDGTSTSDLLVGGGGGGSLFTDGGATTYLTADGDNLALGGTDSSAPFFFDAGAELLTLTNTTSGLSFQVNDEAGDTTPFVIDADGNVGIGTSTPGAKLDIAGASSTITNSSGDITINAASGTISLAGDSLTNVLNGTFSGDVVLNGGQLQLGNHASNPTSIGEGSLVYNSTDKKLYYYKDTGWSEVGKVYTGTSNQTLRHDGSDWVASSALQNDGTNVTTTGQMRVGNYAVKPAGIGEGALVYDTALSTLFVYDGTDWKAISTGQTHTATGVVQDGSYLQLTHNEDTFDLIASAWVKVGSEWKQVQDVSHTIDHDLENEFNARYAQKKKADTVQIQYNENNLGNGADGAATFSTDKNINIDTGVGRSCGDGVNYSVTALTSTTATLESSPSNPTCLAPGDEVLLINLRGTNSAFVNVGNYETFRIASISTNVVTFTSTKTKYYGANIGDDSNIGLGTGNQTVMLQRVPNYTNVTISTSGTDLVPSDWTIPSGSADANTETASAGAGEGGILFFRASGTVSVAASTTINANTKGYTAGIGYPSSANGGGNGGEGVCGIGGVGSTTTGTAGAGGGGGPSGGGGVGYCGGGGGNSGTGSASSGGAGGGSGYLGSGGGAAGYGTAGTGGVGYSGAPNGGDGGTNSSGNGGSGSGGGGGGGGTYGDAGLLDLFLGSGGAGGGSYTDAGSIGANGGDGGGAIYIAANTISLSGGIQSNAGAGNNSGCASGDYEGGGGGGSGGSIKLIGNTVTLGSSLATSTGGSRGSGCLAGVTAPNNGGLGGSGRIAVYYSSSVSGTTSPTYNSNSLDYNTYAIFVGEEVETPNATALNTISWTENLPTGTEIQVQTRSGSSADSTDGSWEVWKPSTSSVSLETANTHTNWSGTNMTVADGDLVRNTNYFEDEDESSPSNITKGTASAANGYAESTISSTDISTYQYLSLWVRSSIAGNSLKIGFGESAATEQEETITVNAPNTWQKVYWDISDITGSARNAVTKLRLTSTQNGAVVYLDNLKAETFLSTASGATITSTPNNYIQYRFVLTTTNTANTPILSDVRVNLTNPDGTVTIDADRIRALNDIDYHTSARLNISEEDLDDTKSSKTDIGLSEFKPESGFSNGDGSDGAITVSSDTSINTTNLSSGRSCIDGGDAVNYSVTELTSNSATLESTPSTGCLSAGDEVLLINLRGTYTAFSNVGNNETLTVSSVSSQTVRFTTSKTNYYGDNSGDDTNIGLGTGNQAVMLQRVPNYTDVTITTSGTDFYPDEWVQPTGSVNNGGGEGGVLFFKASGTVSVAAGTTINANGRGYIAGAGYPSSANGGGDGGESICGIGGVGSVTTGSAGAGGGGGQSAGGNAYCGGGGGNSGLGSASTGGAGGGSGYLAAGGGAGGYGTAGTGGMGYGGYPNGGDGGTNQSGDGGGPGPGGGGGGGGTYGDSGLLDLFFGSAGAGGGSYTDSGSLGAAGGDGGGVIYIAANTVTISGSLENNGLTGNSTSCTTGDYEGAGGGGAGGSTKILGNTLTIGSGVTTSTGGAKGSGCTNGSVTSNNGGLGGSGRIAIYYTVSVSGSTSPAAETASIASYSYAVYISDELPTIGATGYNTLSWLADLNQYGNVQIQTRSGATTNATDGSWEGWRPATDGTNTIGINNADDYTAWNSPNLKVSDGDTTRNMDEFEDEDETNSSNLTKLNTTGFETDTGATLNSSLTSYWALNESSGTRSDSYDGNNLTANGTGGVGSATGKKSNAADFESSESDFLEIADNSDMSTGDIDFTLSAWVYMESKAAGTQYILSRENSGTVREYNLIYTGTGASDRFAFITYNSSGTQVCSVSANSFGSPSVSTWYLIVAWHDSVADTCNVQVSNGSTNSAAETGVPSDTAANFRVAAAQTTEIGFFDGSIDEVGFWKKTLSTQERTDLYNSGSANTYAVGGQYTEGAPKDFISDSSGTLTTNLNGYWPLNENSDSSSAVTRYDHYGTSHLTDNNTVASAYGNGLRNNVADLEASNSEFLEVGDNSALSTGDIDFSISAWVKMESKPGSNMRIISKSDSASVREYEVLWSTSSDRFIFLIYDNTGTEIDRATANNLGAPSLDTWYHIVAWHDSVANTVNIKVNNGTADSSSTGGAGPVDTSANFRIGAAQSTESFFFDGLIDEVGFWKKALSASEITALYNSGSGTTLASDLSSYDFITVWIRSSVAGNNLQLGFGENSAQEWEETFSIDTANRWQKIYWDITDIPYQDRNVVTELRVTNLSSTANTIYIDNFTADRYMRNPGGSAITSTPNDYIQYRVIMSTTNVSFKPTVYNVRISWNSGYKIELTDENTARLYNYSGQSQELKLTVSASGGASGGNSAWTETGGNVYRATGNVGIGDTTPDTELKVVGSLCVKADANDCAGDVAGTIYANNTSLQSADLAEKYKVDDKSIDAGTLVSLSNAGDREVERTTLENADKLMGAVSTAPGLIMNDSRDDNYKPIGLVGRLPVKVITSSLSIYKGDAITASPVPGFGIVANTPGYIVGRAIEDTLSWSPDTCTAVETMEDIEWPEDKGQNEAKPCFALSVLTLPEQQREQLADFGISEEETIYVGKVMTYVDVKWAQPTWMTNGLAQMARDYENGQFGSSDAYWTRDDGTLISTEDVFANSFNGNKGFFDVLSGGMLNIGDRNFVVDSGGNVDIAGDLILDGRLKSDDGGFIIALGDSEGEKLFEIKNSNDETVFSVDSKGQVGGKGVYKTEWLKVEAGKSIEVKHNFGATPSVINITKSEKSNGENFTTQGLGTEYYYEAKDKDSIKVYNKGDKTIYVKLTIQR